MKTGTPLLEVLAGPVAYRRIRAAGLQLSDIKYVVGSAGGPKALAVNGLDQFVFGRWLHQASHRITLVGSSISAWRFTCAMQSDPARALSAFARSFIEVDTWLSGTIHTRADLARDLIRDVIAPFGQAVPISTHPRYDLAIPTAVCRGLLRSNNPLALRAGLALAAVSNRTGRDNLRMVFRSAVFATAPERFFIGDKRRFHTTLRRLGHDNLQQVLAATAAIPLVMPSVAAPGIQGTVLRDGGLLDYVYTDFENLTTTDLMLIPHFSETLHASWFDRWDRLNRNSRLLSLDNAVVIRPSRQYVQSLPNGKIPERKDYFSMSGSRRQQAWSEVVSRSSQLAESMERLLESDRILEHLKPLGGAL